MRTHYRFALATVLSTVLVVIGACASSDAPADSPAVAAEPNVVLVTATDHAFDAPAEVPAGMTTFRLANHGQAIHHVIVVRIDSGKTYDELLAAFAQPGPPPAWATFLGGPNPPAPHGESNATFQLDAGNYALICLVDVPGGVPHIAHGMSRPMVVTPASAAAIAASPAADVTISLFDYNFTLSGPVTAGTRTFEVVGAPGQMHEVVLFRLAEGRTATEMVEWVEKMDGPPPGELMGGTAPAMPGIKVWFKADMAPGSYALVCFIPDHQDGKPHFMHGMVKEFTVE